MWFFALIFLAVVAYFWVAKKGCGRGVAGGRPAALPVAAGGETGSDSWEGWFYESDQQRFLHARVRLRYVDAAGQRTERAVDVRGYDPRGKTGLVFGFCHLRDENRTFRFDRVQSAVDMDTGEVIDDLLAYLNAKWLALPAASLDRLVTEHADALRLMFCMAKADGAMRAAELDVMALYCRELTGDARIAGPDVRDVVQGLDLLDVPAFGVTYKKLQVFKPDAAERVAAVCRDLVATQKTIHPRERALLDML